MLSDCVYSLVSWRDCIMAFSYISCIKAHPMNRIICSVHYLLKGTFITTVGMGTFPSFGNIKVLWRRIADMCIAVRQILQICPCVHRN